REPAERPGERGADDQYPQHRGEYLPGQRGRLAQRHRQAPPVQRGEPGGGGHAAASVRARAALVRCRKTSLRVAGRIEIVVAPAAVRSSRLARSVRSGTVSKLGTET